MRRVRASARDDTGTTLLEMVVAMSILSVVLAVFMAGMINITSMSHREVNRSAATDTVWEVYTSLDRQVRYAEAINLPGPGSSGSTYVEFRLAGEVSRSGQPTCVQWRYDPTAGTLARRTWPDVVPETPGAFSTVGSHVLASAGGATPYPFQVLLASASTHQRLVLHLRVGTGDTTPVTSDTTFVARNSSENSVSNVDTNPADGQSDVQVCMAGGRP